MACVRKKIRGRIFIVRIIYSKRQNDVRKPEGNISPKFKMRDIYLLLFRIRVYKLYSLESAGDG